MFRTTTFEADSKYFTEDRGLVSWLASWQARWLASGLAGLRASQLASHPAALDRLENLNRLNKWFESKYQDHLVTDV